MSESDSDLDFESADEDASCDVIVNNNSRDKCDNSENDNLAISNKEIETKSLLSYSEKHDVCKDSSESDVRSSDKPQIENEYTTSVHDEKSSLEKSCSETNPSKDTELDKIPKDTYVHTTYEIKGESKDCTNKVQHEKQRVPLRLEKKIQQKQQMSKDSSIESDSMTVTDSVSKKPELKSSWGFGSWGTNLLSSAASSVSTFTNQVSQGIGTVLETVESTLGAPAPEELAATLKDKNESNDSLLNKVEESGSNIEAQEEDTFEAKSSILPSVASWTKVLENTGSKVIMGGLDTLELIGKKTIDIITEGDPGLRKKRAVFSDGITLSQILREAKAEADEKKEGENSEGVDIVHYSQMFDEYQGLVHLEALEMLSKQSEGKIQMILMKLPRNSEIRKNIEEIKSICENIPQLDDLTDCEDFEDFLTVCKKYVLELNVTFNIENIIKAQKRITDVLKNYENMATTTSSPEEIYHSAICSLAEFTAKSIEAFHKFAEQILVQSQLESDTEHIATNLTGLTTVMCIEINNVSSRYHHCLDCISGQSETDDSNKINVTTIVTNLYLEAANSNKYIQDAFLLLVPILQVSVLESSE